MKLNTAEKDKFSQVCCVVVMALAAAFVGWFHVQAGDLTDGVVMDGAQRKRLEANIAKLVGGATNAVDPRYLRKDIYDISVLGMTISAAGAFTNLANWGIFSNLNVLGQIRTVGITNTGLTYFGNSGNPIQIECYRTDQAYVKISNSRRAYGLGVDYESSSNNFWFADITGARSQPEIRFDPSDGRKLKVDCPVVVSSNLTAGTLKTLGPLNMGGQLGTNGIPGTADDHLVTLAQMNASNAPISAVGNSVQMYLTTNQLIGSGSATLANLNATGFHYGYASMQPDPDNNGILFTARQIATIKARPSIGGGAGIVTNFQAFVYTNGVAIDRALDKSPAQQYVRDTFSMSLLVESNSVAQLYISVVGDAPIIVGNEAGATVETQFSATTDKLVP